MNLPPNVEGAQTQTNPHYVCDVVADKCNKVTGMGLSNCSPNITSNLVPVCGYFACNKKKCQAFAGIDDGTSIICDKSDLNNPDKDCLKKIDGDCGPLEGEYQSKEDLLNRPDNACAFDTVPYPFGYSDSVDGTVRVTWTCPGLNGGDDSRECVATIKTKKIDGKCGTADKTYPADATGYGSDKFCDEGTLIILSDKFPDPGEKITWSCEGINGGQPATCMAEREKKICDPATNCSGHGTCNEDGTCECEDGWEPPNCMTPSATNPHYLCDIVTGNCVEIPGWGTSNCVIGEANTAGSCTHLACNPQGKCETVGGRYDEHENACDVNATPGTEKSCQRYICNSSDKCVAVPISSSNSNIPECDPNAFAGDKGSCMHYNCSSTKCVFSSGPPTLAQEQLAKQPQCNNGIDEYPFKGNIGVCAHYKCVGVSGAFSCGLASGGGVAHECDPTVDQNSGVKNSCSEGMTNPHFECDNNVGVCVTLNSLGYSNCKVTMPPVAPGEDGSCVRNTCNSQGQCVTVGLGSGTGLELLGDGVSKNGCETDEDCKKYICSYDNQCVAVPIMSATGKPECDPKAFIGDKGSCMHYGCSSTKCVLSKGSPTPEQEKLASEPQCNNGIDEYPFKGNIGVCAHYKCVGVSGAFSCGLASGGGVAHECDPTVDQNSGVKNSCSEGYTNPHYLCDINSGSTGTCVEIDGWGKSNCTQGEDATSGSCNHLACTPQGQCELVAGSYDTYGNKCSVNADPGDPMSCQKYICNSQNQCVPVSKQSTTQKLCKPTAFAGDKDSCWHYTCNSSLRCELASGGPTTSKQEQLAKQPQCNNGIDEYPFKGNIGVCAHYKCVGVSGAFSCGLASGGGVAHECDPTVDQNSGVKNSCSEGYTNPHFLCDNNYGHGVCALVVGWGKSNCEQGTQPGEDGSCTHLTCSPQGKCVPVGSGTGSGLELFGENGTSNGCETDENCKKWICNSSDKCVQVTKASSNASMTECNQEAFDGQPGSCKHYACGRTNPYYCTLVSGMAKTPDETNMASYEQCYMQMADPVEKGAEGLCGHYALKFGKCVFVKGWGINECTADGTCGEANGKEFAEAPTKPTDLCSAGNPVNFEHNAKDSMWAWNCDNGGEGKMPVCSAKEVVKGACGPASESNGGEPLVSAPTDPALLCSAGNPSQASLSNDSKNWNWKCIGSGENPDNLTVPCGVSRKFVDGECGPAVNDEFTEANPPKRNLCVSGNTVLNFSYEKDLGGWGWNCESTDVNGKVVFCFAAEKDKKVNGVCGTSAKTYPYNVADWENEDFCDAYDLQQTPSFPESGKSVEWTCEGKYGGTDTPCTASRAKKGEPVCGPADERNGGGILASAPTNPADLCSAGQNSIASASSDGKKWEWTCNDLGGYSPDAGVLCYTGKKIDDKCGGKCQHGSTCTAVSGKCACDATSWQGEYCENPVCASGCGGPNKGTCTAPGVCTCKPGWTKKPDCSEADNPNNSGCTDTCKNGGACKANTCSCSIVGINKTFNNFLASVSGGYLSNVLDKLFATTGTKTCTCSCNCPKDYDTATKCSTKLPKCTDKETCNNNGYCTPSGTCSCTPAFNGDLNCKTCGLDWFPKPSGCSNFCDSSTCGSHGSCDPVNGLPCVCKDRYTGPTCAVAPGAEDDKCTATTCSGHGRCENGVCFCDYMWMGDPNCSTCTSGWYPEGVCWFPPCDDARDCSSPNGTCDDENPPACFCSPFWQGNANCSICTTGYFGNDCKTKKCDSTSCGLHQYCNANTYQCQCYNDSTNGYWAGTDCSTCATNYYGPDCKKQCTASGCGPHSSGCNSAGTCVCFNDAQNGHWYQDGYCRTCASGWAPSGTCDTQCDAGVCNTTGHWAGSCKGDGTCMCKDNWTGDFCENKPADSCDGITCNGNGTCSNGICYCNPYYYPAGVCSIFCDEMGPISLSGVGCNGKGWCNNDGECTCDAGWLPPDCSKQDTCNPMTTCSGHGTCDLTTGTCNCQPGYVLPDCHEASDCGDCGLHGHCDPATDTCICTDNFTGTHCENPPSCIPNWQCNLWGACVSGKQTCTNYYDARNCIPPATCALPSCPPTKNCGSCVPNWQCDSWGACTAGRQTCVSYHDTNNCNPAARCEDYPSSCPPTQLCSSCTNDCNNKGTCVNGICQCTFPYDPSTDCKFFWSCSYGECTKCSEISFGPPCGGAASFYTSQFLCTSSCISSCTRETTCSGHGTCVEGVCQCDANWWPNTTFGDQIGCKKYCGPETCKNYGWCENDGSCTCPYGTDPSTNCAYMYCKDTTGVGACSTCTGANTSPSCGNVCYPSLELCNSTP